MHHFIIFYIIISFSIGMVSLITTIIISVITKDDLFIKYLFFYIAFTFLFIFKFIYEYIDLNIIYINPEVLKLINYFKFNSEFPLILTIPYFAHCLLETSKTRIKNIIFITLTLIAFILSHISKYVIDNVIFEKSIDIFIDILLIAFVIYAFSLGIFNYKNIKRKLNKRIVKSLIIFLGISLPALVIESINYTSKILPFPLYPIWYCGFSLIMTINILLYYVRTTQLTLNLSQFNEIIKNNDISEREKEIILLIIKGYSNYKIGDTLFISINTVKTHLRNIYNKFGIKSRLELISYISNNPEG